MKDLENKEGSKIIGHLSNMLRIPPGCFMTFSSSGAINTLIVRSTLKKLILDYTRR